MATEVDRLPIPHLITIADMKVMFGLPKHSQTPQQWRTRGVLPEPERSYSGVPVWRYEDIVAWAERTKRVVKVPLRDEHA